MLAFAQAQNETVVADAIDRFQRSFKESVLIDELIRKEKVELTSIGRDGRKVLCAEPLRKRAQKPRIQTPRRRVGREGTARLPGLPLMERSKVMPNARLCISSLTVGTNSQEQATPRCRPESWTVPKTSRGTRRSFPSRLRGAGQPCTARAAPNCTDGRLTCISEPLVVSEEDIASYYRPLRDST